MTRIFLNYKGLLGLLILLLVWQLSIFFLAINIPIAKLLAPWPTFITLYNLLISNSLTMHSLASLSRVITGLSIALAIGIPLGFLMGLFKQAEQYLNAPFQFLRMISPISWMPLAVMFLGVGNKPVYFLLAFSALWPIIINTALGVRSTEKNLLNLAKSLNATRLETILHIILPSALNAIFSGLRLSMGVIWIVIVPSEMLGVNSGLGYFILDTRDRLAYSELMATIVLIGLIGWLLDLVCRKIQLIICRVP